VKILSYAHRAPDRRRIAAEPPLPKCVRYHRSQRPARALFVGRKQPPQTRVRTQHAKEFGRHPHHRGELRALADHHRISPAAQIAGQALERRRLIVQIVEIRLGKLIHPVLPFAIAPADHHHPIRLTIIERLEQHRIHHAENRRIRADPQRENDE
jgi:hypothetical protein